MGRKVNKLDRERYRLRGLQGAQQNRADKVPFSNDIRLLSVYEPRAASGLGSLVGSDHPLLWAVGDTVPNDQHRSRLVLVCKRKKNQASPVLSAPAWGIHDRQAGAGARVGPWLAASTKQTSSGVQTPRAAKQFERIVAGATRLHPLCRLSGYCSDVIMRYRPYTYRVKW